MQTVKELQVALKRAGLYAGKVDGIAGLLTFAGLLEFGRGEGRLPPWLVQAGLDLGVSEIAGARHNPRIVLAHRRAGLDPADQTDETAWCGSIMGLWVGEVGNAPPKGFASAKAWESWGTKRSVPVMGSVLTYKRTGGSGRHVCLCAGVVDGNVWVIGGNQGNRVSLVCRGTEKPAAVRWP